MCFSLLAGGGDGYIVIYDVNTAPGPGKRTLPSVGTIALNNKHRHKFSVETVLWYPLDTGLFMSSGADCVLKVWDTNRLKVGRTSHISYIPIVIHFIIIIIY